MIYPTEYETSRKTKMLYLVIKDIASNINRGLCQVYSGTERNRKLIHQLYYFHNTTQLLTCHRGGHIY